MGWRTRELGDTTSLFLSRFCAVVQCMGFPCLQIIDTMTSGATIPPETILKDKDGKEMKASGLFEQGPALVVVLRRPGCCTCSHAVSQCYNQYYCINTASRICTLRYLIGWLRMLVYHVHAVLCREEAITIWQNKDKFPETMRLVCVLHEWRDAEVNAFAPEYWGGELYFDESKAFYAAVHGGKVKKGSLLALLNPFGQAMKNFKRAKDSKKVKDSNLVGDGLTLGGLMVFKKGGEVVFKHAEETFGDHAALDDVVAAAAKAV